MFIYDMEPESPLHICQCLLYYTNQAILYKYTCALVESAIERPDSSKLSCFLYYLIFKRVFQQYFVSMYYSGWSRAY